MNRKYVIGIDNGTQSTRAILFDLQGNKICQGKGICPPMILSHVNHAEHECGDVFAGLCDAIKDLLSKFDGDKNDIAGIGISAQRGTTFFFGEDGQQVRRPISWMDGRWRDNEKAIEKDSNFDEWQQYLIYYSKMNWLQTNEPETAKKVRKYLSASAYLIYCLTGEYKDTLANNLGMPIDRQKYALYEDDRIYEKMGITKEMLPEYVLPGTIVGHVSDEAARITGLPAGCPVVAGAGDKQGEVLGSGTTRPGQAYMTMGTMTGLTIANDCYIPDCYQKMKHRTYTAAVPYTWHGEAAASRGFWLTTWMKGVTSTEESVLDQMAFDISAGSEGLVTIPDWKAIWDRPYAKGAFIGFDARHGKAHMFRSLIEGIILQVKMRSDEMCAETGCTIESIIAGGGGSQSKTAMQAIADIYEMPVEKSLEIETCSLGAAMCAAVGCGYYKDFDAAVKAMKPKTLIIEPIEENSELYRNIFEKAVLPFYSTNEEILKFLSTIK